METSVEYDRLDGALRRCGAGWDASQAHGLLAGRLATAGADAGFEWLSQVLEGTDANSAFTNECEGLLRTLFEVTYRQLAERQSEFEPMLPDDQDAASVRAAALARWCEGFLHGLVSAKHGDALKKRLAAEPLADIIRDMLEITRAAAGDDDDGDSEEAAYTELVEYLRVAAQLTYEELAEIRAPADGDDEAGETPEVLH
jgi:yecA family protein